MGSIKRVSLVATLALAALALTAASASADIVIPGQGTAYSGPVAGVNTGPDPTLETDTTTITCEVATTGGTMNGATPATGELDFSWDQCSVVGGTASCSVDDIEDVSVDIDETNAPDATIINTERGETFISCALVFNCTAASDPADGSEVEAEVASGADPVASIDDTVNVSGVGCPSEGQWVAQYEITVPADGLESNN
jgi:hypothetical protein